MNIMIIAFGGALGTLIRYAMSTLNQRGILGSLPLGTLIVNVTGSFLIGLVWGLSERYAMSPTLRLFLMVGVLGGYTTFSSFSLETLTLVRNSQYVMAMLNTVGAIVMGLAAVSVGYWLTTLELP